MPPLRIALSASRSAPVLARLLADSNRGSVWELSEIAGADYILVCEDALDPSTLARFEGKILAIHEAVYDAILFGESETRSSVYLLNDRGERGPLFLLGAPYPLAPMALDARERGDAAFLTQYAELHRQWMRMSWGDLLARAIELLAGGTMQIVGDVVWIDGAPGPCRMGHSPSVCHEPETMLARGIPRSCPFID